MGSFLLRATLTGLALWVVTLFVPGMTFVGGATTLQKVGIIFVVAVIFGLVNAVIKPIVQIISIPLYVLTLGLFHVVVNALMLWITSWITEHTTHWGAVHRPLLVDRDLGGHHAVDRQLAALPGRSLLTPKALGMIGFLLRSSAGNLVEAAQKVRRQVRRQVRRRVQREVPSDGCRRGASTATTVRSAVGTPESPGRGGRVEHL